MRKLPPAGPNPLPAPKREVLHFKVDVVRSALSSFGPTSAAGLFESFHFSSALTNACNHFAAGAAPSFLTRYIAGGVSIALETNATAVRPLACGDPETQTLIAWASEDRLSQRFQRDQPRSLCESSRSNVSCHV